MRNKQRVDARSDRVKALIQEVKKLIGQYPLDSHYFIARMLNVRNLKTPTHKTWTAQNLRLFMTNQRIPHKCNYFSIQNVIEENRAESMRLV